MNMECGSSEPLFSSRPPRRPGLSEPRLAEPSVVEPPHSIAGSSDSPETTKEVLRTGWHHSPIHVLLERGVYMVTAGTYGKVNFFLSPERRDLLLEQLRICTAERGWELEAWAVMANHYHFIALSPDDPVTLCRVLNKLHMTMAKAVNKFDGTPGRKVWHEFWDTHLTFERSYLARLHYVNHNPVHHRLVDVASHYRWCSAAHFEKHVSPAFQRTVADMPIDKIELADDF